MTKQEQIKEITQIICRRCKGNICLFDNDSCDCNCSWSKDAEKIYNAKYRKIPKNAVVLTIEEYRLIAELCRRTNRASKYTAKEILNAVDNESNGQTISITNYLRKKYGVEVEE